MPKSLLWMVPRGGANYSRRCLLGPLVGVCSLDPFDPELSAVAFALGSVFRTGPAFPTR